MTLGNKVRLSLLFFTSWSAEPTRFSTTESASFPRWLLAGREMVQVYLHSPVLLLQTRRRTSSPSFDASPWILWHASPDAPRWLLGWARPITIPRSLALFTLTSLRIPSRGESPRTGACCLASGRGRLQKQVTLQERLLPLLMAAHLHFAGLLFVFTTMETLIEKKKIEKKKRWELRISSRTSTGCRGAEQREQEECLLIKTLLIRTVSAPCFINVPTGILSKWQKQWRSARVKCYVHCNNLTASWFADIQKVCCCWFIVRLIKCEVLCLNT